MKVEIVFVVEAQEEATRVRGNAVASGDADVDRRVEDAILARLNGGDLWAWCYVKVTGTILVDGKSFVSASDWLGCCSYENEEDFRKGGYFDDMKQQIRDRLVEELHAQENRGKLAPKILASLPTV